MARVLIWARQPLQLNPCLLQHNVASDPFCQYSQLLSPEHSNFNNTCAPSWPCYWICNFWQRSQWLHLKEAPLYGHTIARSSPTRTRQLCCSCPVYSRPTASPRRPLKSTVLLPFIQSTSRLPTELGSGGNSALPPFWANKSSSLSLPQSTPLEKIISTRAAH